MLLDPSEALHERGLADAVDADEPDPLPGGDAERDVAELEALTVVRLAEAVAVHEACTSAGGGGDGGRSAGGGGRAVCARVFVQAALSIDAALMLVYQTVGETFPGPSQTGEGFLLPFDKRG